MRVREWGIGIASAVVVFLTFHAPAMAAETLDGRTLGIGWSVPFAGLLLSMAVFPLFLQRTWAVSYTHLDVYKRQM